MRKRIVFFSAAAGIIILCIGTALALSRQQSASAPDITIIQDAPEFIMPERTSGSSAASLPTEEVVTPAGSSEQQDHAETDQTVTTGRSSAETNSTVISSSSAEQTSPAGTESTIVPGTSADQTSPAETVKTVVPGTSTVQTTPAETVENVVSVPEEFPDNVLISSCDPENYIRFEFQQDRILLSGVYSMNEITKISVLKKSISSTDLVHFGNEFSGSIDTSSLKEGFYILRFYPDSGAVMDYVFEITEQGTQPVPEDKLPAERNLTVTKAPLEIPEDTVLKLITADGDRERAAEILRQIKEISDEVCEGLNGELDKARALSQWVSQNIFYDHDAKDNGVTDDMLTLEYLLENHRSVCYGWTNLYSALCQAQGIECYNVNGSVVTGSRCFLQTEPSDERSHSWNMLIIDGEKIWVDTVWNSTNRFSKGEYQFDSTKMHYFGITNGLLAHDHRAERCEYRDYFGAVG